MLAFAIGVDRDSECRGWQELEEERRRVVEVQGELAAAKRLLEQYRRISVGLRKVPSLEASC